VAANKFYEAITQNTLHGHQWTAPERKEIDGLMRKRERLLRRLAKVEASLATIQKDGPVIKKHCLATANKIQAAIQVYKKELRDAESLVLGMEFMVEQRLKEAKAKLRRLMILPPDERILTRMADPDDA
jgi:hypothetical protein